MPTYNRCKVRAYCILYSVSKDVEQSVSCPSNLEYFQMEEERYPETVTETSNCDIFRDDPVFASMQELYEYLDDM